MLRSGPEGLSGLVVGVEGCFEGGEDGGHAGVSAFEEMLPLVAGAGEEKGL